MSSNILNRNIFLNKYLVIFLVLLIQNIFIFYKHYFNGYGIPWDFMETYLAIPYYWIEAAKLNIDTAWLPFQGMGYPLHMQLQSGYYYLPNWIFVLLDLDYTVTAATIFQDIHILFGAVGAVVAGKYFNLNWTESLLVGVIYQSFGGFYTNAEHIDIIRAYAFLPWLLGPILGHWNYKNRYYYIGISLLPLWTYLLWTGGYLGISIATSFVLGMVLVIRIILEKQERGTGFAILFALVIGVIIMSIAYIPALMQLNELDRSGQILSYDYFKWIDIFALIYPVDITAFPHDISMRFTSVGFVSFLLFVIGLPNIFHWNKYLLFTLILSLFMASGILHHVLISYIPQLGMSRFTLSDYKGIIALSFIILSIQNYKYISNKSIYFSVVFTLIYMIFGNLFLNMNTQKNLYEILFMLAIFIAIIGILLINKEKWENVIFTTLILITILDWYRVHGNKGYIFTPDATKQIENRFGTYSSTQSLLHKAWEEPSSSRPKRTDLSLTKSVRSYYTGEYMMRDYGGSEKLNVHKHILAVPKLYAFALSKWKAVDVVPILKVPETNKQIKIENIKQIYYSGTHIKYKVNLDKNTTIVENEIYWKGWTMDIHNKKGGVNILKPVNIEGFRGWNLPSGKYTMDATYNMPYKKLSIFMGLLGIILWGIFLYYYRLYWRKEIEE